MFSKLNNKFLSELNYEYEFKNNKILTEKCLNKLTDLMLIKLFFY